MQILIDFTPIPIEKLGVGIYAVNLINHLHKIDQRNNYHILLQDDESCFDAITGEKFKKIFVPAKIFRHFACRFFLEQLYIPWFIRKNKIDIVHSLHYTFPILSSKAKKIITIHDMTFILFPEYHEWIKRIYFSFFLKVCDQYAQNLIFISNATLQDFSKMNGTVKSKTAVIHFGRNDWGKLPFDRNKIETIKKKYKIEGEYLLFIGTIEPRKNLTTLLRAYEKLLLQRKNLKLVIAGKRGWHDRPVMNLSKKEIFQNQLIFTGYVDEADKPFLMKGAKLFLYPSLYEGFGIPVLEAMSLGVPTITSNVSSLPEVAGSGAMIVDPRNENELLRCMLNLLEDENERYRLEIKAVRRSEAFSWKKMAHETLHQYEQAYYQ